MLAEQTLLNAGVIAADLTATDAAVTGYVFSALLIARAPLQLFQAVQGSLLPHLAGLEAKQGKAEFEKAIRITILAIAGFALAVALGLLVLGPFAMDLLFDDDKTFGRFGLAAVALGMGFHLAAGTLNQAALARDHAGTAAIAWLVAAAVFLAWMFADVIDDELLRAEVGLPRRGELAVCPARRRVSTPGQHVTPGGLSRRGGRTMSPGLDIDHARRDAVAMSRLTTEL